MVWNLKDLGLVLEKLLFSLYLLVMLFCISVIVLLVPVANVGCFLATLYFNLEVLGFNGFKDFDVDFAIDCVSWLVEGELGLDLNLALIEFASIVLEKEHCLWKEEFSNNNKN